MLMGVIYRMKKSYVTNRINTQVTHPFLYPTRMRNKKKYFFKLMFNNNEKSFLKNKNFLFIFINKKLNLWCVNCVLIMGVFAL